MDETSVKRRLIDEISIRPILYDPKHKDKKNRQKLSNAWRDVATAVGLNGKFFIEKH